MAELYVKHLPDGTKLQGGKYEIVRFINSGGFGCTYEARFPMLRTRVAIKEFFMGKYCVRDQQTGWVSPSTEESQAIVEKCRKKFVDEASILYGMSHRSIVRVADIFEENGTAYFAMDFISGRTLTEIVRDEGPMPEHKAIACMRQICQALDYLHAGNRLHLDIKPDNIMIDDNGRAVLIDFGASKYLDNASSEEKRVTSNVVQTPGYSPNEQLTGDVSRFTNATDLYALGATLYYVLSGVTPVSGTLRAAGEELDPLPETISLTTRQAIDKAMELMKSDRPQTAMEFNALLKDVPVVERKPKPEPKQPAAESVVKPQPKKDEAFERDSKTAPKGKDAFERDGKTAPKGKDAFERDSKTAPKGKDAFERDSKTAPKVEKPFSADEKTVPVGLGGAPSVFDIPQGKKSKAKKSKAEAKPKTQPVIKDIPKKPKNDSTATDGGGKRKALIFGGAALGIVLAIVLINLLGGDSASVADVQIDEPKDTVAVVQEVVEEVAVDSANYDVVVPPVIEEAAAQSAVEQQHAASQDNKPDMAESKPQKAEEAEPQEAEEAKPAGPTPEQLMEKEFRRAMALKDGAEKQKALMALANKNYAPAYAPLASVSLVLYDDDNADKYARRAIAAGHGPEVRAVVNALAAQGYYDDPAHGKKPL